MLSLVCIFLAIIQVCLSLRMPNVRLSASRLQAKVSPGDGLTAGFKYDVTKIRNFSIIAHIDHGKSTLADRLLEFTKTVEQRDMQQQLLDNLSIERERGITIKLQAARINYTAKDGEMYLLNLIDSTCLCCIFRLLSHYAYVSVSHITITLMPILTLNLKPTAPGHVDFGYEVSRSLAACEGALLVVDAAQGVEAQTMANVYLALENDLEIIPVINKIDLPAADPDKVIEEVESLIGLDCTNNIKCSAKTGLGIEDILEEIVKTLPSPPPNVEKDLRALIFDSYFDPYRGVVVFFRVIDGKVARGDKIRFKNSGKEYEVLEVGVMTPNEIKVNELKAGEVGFFSASIKSVDDARVGDTITHVKCHERVEALPGYQPARQMVFAGLYPSESDDYESLRDAIGKLKVCLSLVQV